MERRYTHAEWQEMLTKAGDALADIFGETGFVFVASTMMEGSEVPFGSCLSNFCQDCVPGALRRAADEMERGNMKRDEPFQHQVLN